MFLKILSASAHCPVRKPVLHFQISMQDTGCLGLVHWDDPEGWDGEGGGRGVQDGEHMYTLADSCQCMTKPIQYCKVISLQKNKLIKKQKKQEVTKFSSRNSQTPKNAL